MYIKFFIYLIENNLTLNIYNIYKYIKKCYKMQCVKTKKRIV